MSIWRRLSNIQHILGDTTRALGPREKARKKACGSIAPGDAEFIPGKWRFARSEHAIV
jgi:hypothetical protein